MNGEIMDMTLVGPIAHSAELWSGLMFGALFGFLLQRGHIVRYDKQIGMLQLKDMTVMKYMLSAALVGAIGMFFLRDVMYYNWDPRPVFIIAFVCGGLIFGLGWAICGYCPGTLLGAMGEGRWDALWPFLGGVAGSVVYANLAHPFVKHFTMEHLDFPEGLDLHLLLGISPWLVIAAFAAACIALFWWFEKRGL